VNPSRIHTEQSRVNPKRIHTERSCEGLSATTYDRVELTGSSAKGGYVAAFPRMELTIARRSQPPRRTSTRKARSCPHTRGQIAHKNEPVVTFKRPSGRPLLTDSAPPVEFALTHSKQTTVKILTEARTHIRILRF
jgi:phosphopantetheinyl transferase